MSERPMTHSRTERAIALARAALAGVAWLSVWLDPLEPARHQALAYSLVACYFLFAIGLACVAMRATHVLPRAWPMATHAIDIAAFSVLLLFTQGGSSPFFSYYLFSVTTATIRWQWRGALATGAVTLLLFVLIAIASVGEMTTAVLVSRALSLTLATTLLAAVGAVYGHRHRQLELLAAWPRTAGSDRRALAREVLEFAARILDAPRLLLIWEETEEPRVAVAMLDSGRYSWREEPPGTFGDLVAEPLRSVSFMARHAADRNGTVLFVDNQAVARWVGAPIAARVCERFRIGRVVSWPVHSIDIDGRLFCLDRDDFWLDDVRFGDVVARLVGTSLSHAELLNQVRQQATVEYRIQLARDLHDGVLQSLTGVALQLQAARRLLPRDPAAAGARLQELQQILAAEHGDIRTFIDQLRPAGRVRGDVHLAGQLRELAQRVGRQWAVDVQVAIEPEPLLVSDSVASEVYLLAHEALVNAARHAHASHVSVAVLQGPDNLSIVVADDGKGFPFGGTMTAADLMQAGAGPATLLARTTALGGELLVDSGPAGARVEMHLPVGAARL